MARRKQTTKVRAQPLLMAQARTFETARVNPEAWALVGLADEAYGDSSLWTLIAAANNLTDPWIDGIATLTIPRQGGKQPTGGVLGG